MCRPDEKIICVLNGIDVDSALLEINLRNQLELSFDYSRYVCDNEGVLVESNGYNLLNVGMYIFVEKVGFFRLSHPPFKYDGSVEKKSIQAYSAECELEYKDLVNFKINTGETDSLEYLVSYDDDESESLLNPYNNLPYDYILFYDTRADELKSLTKDDFEFSEIYTDKKTIVTDIGIVNKIVDLCTFIPRLKNRVVTTTDESGEKHSELLEFVSYSYDSGNKSILSVTLNGFKSRVDSLITFYTKYRAQLSLLDLAIEKCNCNWTIGDVDVDLANKKFQFSIDSRNIYAFLTQDIASVSKCITQFDRVNRKINIVAAENIGEDTGVVIARNNLLNSDDISCDETSLVTRFNVNGGNNLGISDVNFGLSRIDNISYFLSASDNNGERIYVDDSLAEHYEVYCSDREHMREKYIELSKKHNQTLIDIDEIKYRVPNDYLSTDWSQYTEDELSNLYSVYQKMLFTLNSMYKEEFSEDLNDDGTINETKIKETPYWYDYYAYKEILIQISEAIKALKNNTSYKNISDNEIVEKISAYKTEWSLYGVVELENKISGYENVMQLLLNNGNIILSEDGTPKSWSDLTDGEKVDYNRSEINYSYNEYKEAYDNLNSANEYLQTLKAELSRLENARKSIQDTRTSLAKLADIKYYSRAALVDLGVSDIDESDSSFDCFTAKEIEVINLLYVDSDYSNENILQTSIDTIVSSVDLQLELFNDAKEQLSISAQPQFKFDCSMDNLLSLSDYKYPANKFDVGNYVTVQYYDDYYVKLRLVKFAFNPCLPSSNSLNVEFSNFVKSNTELTDIPYIIGAIGNTGNGSSSVSSGSSGIGGSGTIGNDIDVTLSDTMLSKLVNTELFGTAVTDVLLDSAKLNLLTAKNATFGDLAEANTYINGKGIKTGKIISNDKSIVFDLDNNAFSCIKATDENENNISLNDDQDITEMNVDGMIMKFSSNGLNIEVQEAGSNDAPSNVAALCTNKAGIQYSSYKDLPTLDSENTVHITGNYSERPVESDYTAGKEGRELVLAKIAYRAALAMYNALPITLAFSAFTSSLFNAGVGFLASNTKPSVDGIDFGASFLRSDGFYHMGVSGINDTRNGDNRDVQVKFAYGRYGYEGYANALYKSSSSEEENIKIASINSDTSFGVIADSSDDTSASAGVVSSEYTGISDLNFTLIDGMVIDIIFEHNQMYGILESQTEALFLNVCNSGDREIYIYGRSVSGRRGINAWCAGETVRFRYEGTPDSGHWLLVGRSNPEKIFKGIVFSDVSGDADLLCSPGLYIIRPNETALTWNNLPEVYDSIPSTKRKRSGYLFVLKRRVGESVSDSYIKQIFTPVNNDGIYTRFYNPSDSGSWSPWKKQTMSDKYDFSSKVVLADGEGTSGNYNRFVYLDGRVDISYRGGYKAHAKNDLLFTLPTEYAPSIDVYAPIVFATDASGKTNIVGAIKISTDGKVTIHHMNAASYDTRPYFQATYYI